MLVAAIVCSIFISGRLICVSCCVAQRSNFITKKANRHVWEILLLFPCCAATSPVFIPLYALATPFEN
jgi:hypothetical protein